jgi:hypothetical protein
MRPEDKSGASLIDRSGRGPLCFGEKESLAQQRRNRADDGKTPGQVEEQTLRAITTDSGGLKAPVHKTWSRHITVR